jgi:hypothetical protein
MLMMLQSSSSQPLMICMLQILFYKYFSKLVDWPQTWTKHIFFPIQGNQVDLDFLIANNATFSCTYLGLPLHIKKLPKSLFQWVI